MNLLLIAIDTLRADHLGCYGYGRTTSPHLDALAERGVLFEQHISPHIPTHPGYTTLFTGKDVFTHQIVTQGGKVDLDEEIRTLPQILRSRGYFTAAADNMGRWFNRGYDAYEGYNWQRDTSQPWRKARGSERGGAAGARRLPQPGPAVVSASCTIGTRTRRICRRRPLTACSTPAMRPTPPKTARTR